MPERSKTGYLLEDCRIFYNADRKMKTIPLHYHDFHKIVILLAGNTSYMIEGRSYDLLPGDMVLVRAGAMHRPLVHDSSLYERIIIYISPFFTLREKPGAESAVPDPEVSAGRPAGRHFLPEPDPVSDLFGSGAADSNPGFRELVRPNRDAASSFTEIFRQMKGLAGETPASRASFAATGTASAAVTGIPETDTADPPYASSLYGRIKTAELMILLMRCIRGDQFLPAHSASSGSMAEKIMAFIRENLSDPDLNVDRAASHMNLNRSYLMHYFKEQTGYTIGNYITEKRLFLARSRILKGEAATSVCYDCGFGSYSAFYRAYTGKYGISPAGRRDKGAKKEGPGAAALPSSVGNDE